MPKKVKEESDNEEEYEMQQQQLNFKVLYTKNEKTKLVKLTYRQVIQ